MTTERLDAHGNPLLRVTKHRAQTRDLLKGAYDELRALAHWYLRRERKGHTLQPTALVHEAYIRLSKIDRIAWRSKTHFFSVAARQMRRVLVEHARRVGAQKRGAGWDRITLGEHLAIAHESSGDLLALDQALSRLSGASPRQARVAELRLFAGLHNREIAEMLAVSERTAQQDWLVARAWLADELAPQRKSGS